MDFVTQCFVWCRGEPLRHSAASDTPRDQSGGCERVGRQVSFRTEFPIDINNFHLLSLWNLHSALELISTANLSVRKLKMSICLRNNLCVIVLIIIMNRCLL